MNNNFTPFSGPSRTVQEGRRSVSRDNVSSNTLLGRALRRGSGSNSSQTVVQLEEEIDVEQNLRVYSNEQLDALNPRTLYRVGPLNINTVLIRSNREESLRVTDSSVLLDLLTPEAIAKIKQSGKVFAHIGLIVIGIKGLGRKELGTKVLVLIMDKSWKTDVKKAIIAGMEVDLSQNCALFYCSPAILKDIKDLKNLKIGLMTKGYENFQGNNLVVSIGILGKASNRSGMNFSLNIEGIVENLASRGVRMIDPVKIDPEELAGLEWPLKEFSEQNERILVPERSLIYENAQGDYSMRFNQYKEKEPVKEDSDEERNMMNFELGEPTYDTEEDDLDEPIDDTENDELNIEETIGFSYYEELEELEDMELEETAGFKTEEYSTSFDQIIKKKFTEQNIQEQVDDMIIECMTGLGMNYEDAYNKLNEIFNLPLVTDISNGKCLISDFYKPEVSYMDQDINDPRGYKRAKPEFVTPGTSGTEQLGRELWVPATATYQGESSFRGKGSRMPIGKIYSSNMLLIEQQSPQLWFQAISSNRQSHGR